MKTDRSVLVSGGFALVLLAAACASPASDPADPGDWRAEVVATEELDAGDAAASGAGGADESSDGAAADTAAPAPAKARITVQEAVAEALAHNRGVLQARLGVAIGGTYEREARSALLPNVSAQGSYSRVDKAPQAVAPELGTSFTVGPKEVWSFGLNMNFPIYGFGRYLNAFRASVLSRKGEEARRDTVESDIAAAVTAAAFDLLAGIRAVDVAISDEEAFAQQVRDSQALLDAGRVTRSALLEAQVEHDRAIRTRERLQSAIPILRMTLNTLLGRDPHAQIDVVDAPVTRPPIWQPGALEDEAVIRRAELRAARLDVAAAERDLKAAIGRELPELRGNLSYDTSDNRFSNPKDRTTLLLTLDIPVFTGGGRGARIQRARYELDVSRLALRDLEAQVRNEIASRYREADEAYRDIAVAQRSIERSEESLRIQREKFQNGRATSREVLDSTALVTEAKVAYLRALYSYNVAIQELHRARGGDPRQNPFQELEVGGDEG
jgi:outer membrane protein